MLSAVIALAILSISLILGRFSFPTARTAYQRELALVRVPRRTR